MDIAFIAICAAAVDLLQLRSSISFIGNMAAFRNYITTATFSSERTKYISIAAGFQCLGMTIGPALQASLSPLQCSEPNMESYISFDMFTAAGYLN